MTLTSSQNDLNLTTDSSTCSKAFTEHINRQMARIAREAKANERYYRRKKCFPDESFFEMTFDNNAEKQTDEYDKAFKYAEHFEVFREKRAGMIFRGGYGTGKTYLAACVANALIDQGYTCRLTTMESAVRGLMDAAERDVYLKQLTDVDLLIIDDLGAEYQSDFMNAMAFEIINARYVTRKPLIVTTNFTKDEISDPPPAWHRVMSRLWEMCVTVPFEGEDKRRAKLKARQRKMKKRETAATGQFDATSLTNKTSNKKFAIDEAP